MSRICTIIAVVLFLLAAFGVGSFAGLALVPLGLAIWALGGVL